MWTHNYEPIAGSLGVSALVAAIPIFVLFYMLGVRRSPSYIASLTALASAFVLALVAYRMPPSLALVSTLYGVGYGLFPIAWVVFASILLYRIVVLQDRFVGVQRLLYRPPRVGPAAIDEEVVHDRREPRAGIANVLRHPDLRGAHVGVLHEVGGVGLAAAEPVREFAQPWLGMLPRRRQAHSDLVFERLDRPDDTLACGDANGQVHNILLTTGSTNIPWFCVLRRRRCDLSAACAMQARVSFTTTARVPGAMQRRGGRT